MLLKKLKPFLAPVQKKLLKKGFCVACAMPLKKVKDRVDHGKGKEKVTCKCGRVYIFKKEEAAYRRANFDEV